MLPVWVTASVHRTGRTISLCFSWLDAGLDHKFVTNTMYCGVRGWAAVLPSSSDSSTRGQSLGNEPNLLLETKLFIYFPYFEPNIDSNQGNRKLQKHTCKPEGFQRAICTLISHNLKVCLARLYLSSTPFGHRPSHIGSSFSKPEPEPLGLGAFVKGALTLQVLCVFKYLPHLLTGAELQHGKVWPLPHLEYVRCYTRAFQFH